MCIYYSILKEFLYFISLCIRIKGSTPSCTTPPTSLKHQNWSLLYTVVFNGWKTVKPLSGVTFPKLPLSMCLHMTPPKGSSFLEDAALDTQVNTMEYSTLTTESWNNVIWISYVGFFAEKRKWQIKLWFGLVWVFFHFFHFDLPDGTQFQNNQFSLLNLMIVYRTTYFTGKKKSFFIANS